MKIQRTIGIEEAKSRIPGLFAYIDYSEYGGYELHKATDSPQGCYGKVVEALTVPFSLVDGVDVIIRENGVYSYREMMNAYYAYRDVVGRDNLFISFVEDGIGRVETRKEAENRGFPLSDDANLVPEVIYKASAMTLWKKMESLRLSCVMYDKLLSQGESDNDLCCECDRYRRMGGENMQSFLLKLSEEAEETAELLHVLSCYGDGHVSMNIPLMRTMRDIGYYEAIDNGDGEEIPIDWEDTKNDESPNVHEVTDARSELTSLRDGTYVNTIGKEERPGTGEDWLFYYKVGRVKNLRVNIDKNGDIALLNGATDPSEEDGYHTNLDAYGDVITDITVDENERKIKFTYVIGGHLDGKVTPSEQEETKRYYESFKWDGSYYGCRVYSEEYAFDEGGELDMACESPDDNYTLENFVDGSQDIPYVIIDIGVDEPKLTPVSKLPFNTSANIAASELYLGTGYGTSVYIRSSYKTYIPPREYDADRPMIKDDKLMHITYEPSLNNGIYIKRGDNAAFERHIKLSEVKTMDDLMTYANGSYFNVENLN